MIREERQEEKMREKSILCTLELWGERFHCKWNVSTDLCCYRWANTRVQGGASRDTVSVKEHAASRELNEGVMYWVQGKQWSELNRHRNREGGWESWVKVAKHCTVYSSMRGRRVSKARGFTVWNASKRWQRKSILNMDKERKEDNSPLACVYWIKKETSGLFELLGVVHESEILRLFTSVTLTLVGSSGGPSMTTWILRSSLCERKIVEKQEVKMNKTIIGEKKKRRETMSHREKIHICQETSEKQETRRRRDRL